MYVCVWEGIKENRLSPEYVDVILGLMHLCRVLHVLVLFGLLGSGCVVLSTGLYCAV